MWHSSHPAGIISAIGRMWGKSKKQKNLSPKSSDSVIFLQIMRTFPGNNSYHRTGNKSVHLSNKVAILL